MPESLPKLDGAPYFNFERRHMSIMGSRQFAHMGDPGLHAPLRGMGASWSA